MERDQERKKRYERPVVKRFELRPQEAVLGFCKSGTTMQPGQAGCGNAATSCKFKGS